MMVAVTAYIRRLGALVLGLGLALGGVLVVQPAASAAATPKTLVLDGPQLVKIKAQLAASPPAALTAAMAALKRAADTELTAGPWSVMDKTSTVSKDKHDYYS